MKKLALFTLALVLFVGARVYADNGRSKTGAQLTWLLNGAPVFRGTVTSIDAGFVDNSTTATPFALSNGAFVCEVQCDTIALVYNEKTDAGSLGTKALTIAQGEKFPLGLLQLGLPYVSARAQDAGTLNCNIYECK